MQSTTDRSMTPRPFGATGLRVSPLGFGGAEIGFLETPVDEVRSVLGTLLDAGVNVVDTAAMYRDSESLIGRAIGDRRDEFVLISKYGVAPTDSGETSWDPGFIGRQIDASLANLRTDHLDVALLHSRDLEVLEAGDALGALLAARDAGKVRHVGYSGDNEAATWAAARPEIEVLQTSISVADQANIGAALPVARDHDVAVMVKRPIANAAWRKLEDQRGLYQSYAEQYTRRLASIVDHMDGAARARLGIGGSPESAAAAWPSVALRFTLAQPGVHVAIIGTTNPEHVRANLDAAAGPPLPIEDTQAIRRAFLEAEAAAGGHWPGLT